MDSENAAIDDMFAAYHRLKDMGWNDIMYCPKDGTNFLSVCPGSTGIFRSRYMGDWPKGGWWVEDGGDLWPERPCLWKPLPAPTPGEQK